MPIVDIKGIGKASFPDGMTAETIREFLRKKYAEQAMSGEMKPLTPVQNTAAPYEPTLAEKIGSGIGDTLRDTGIISDNYGAQRIGRNVSTLAEFLPGIGDATAGDDFGRNMSEGNYGLAALDAAGTVPVLGDMAIFAGVLAKNADLGALRKAKLLEDTGADRNKIWKETGWFNDKGDWKFEISDDLAGVDLTPSQEALKRGAPHSERFPFVGENVEHRELLGYQDSAYDDLDTIRSQLTGKTTKGGVYGDSPALKESINPKGEFVELSDDLAGEDGKSVMLHELQHAIQNREGFAEGGSPDFLSVEAANNVLNKFNNDFGGLPQVIKNKAEMAPDEYKNWAIKMYSEQLPTGMQGLKYDQYQRLAGEAEARLVQTRMNLTPEQRRARPPWEDLDVPEDELIYRKGGGINQSLPMDEVKKLPYKEKAKIASEWKTGQPIKLSFARNTESSKNYPTGMDFGQKLEPSGQYMNVDFDDSGFNKGIPNWEFGEIEFKNPLVLEHKSTNSTGWKKDLSEMFDGLTGKRLTNKIKKAGYDGIITKDADGFNETIKL